MSIDWKDVRRVLVVRLRSIGDTVLATPSLVALRRHLPEVQIDILLENWVAPLLDGFDRVDNVIRVGKSPADRLKTALAIRRNKYDVVFNLHGGTTSTFFTRASGAPHRVGYRYYQYSAAYNHLLSSPSDFWKQERLHSAEQQLALLGFVGVPVEDRPKSQLTVTQVANETINQKLEKSAICNPQSAFAMIHPAAAFETKRWPIQQFAQAAEFLHEKGMTPVAVVSKSETTLLTDLASASKVPIVTFNDLSLPEITALASRAKIFFGNDSGIAHIAAAVGTPTVVVFGSSNRDHWRPWADFPNEVVFEAFDCQPCAGYECKVFGEPLCILQIDPAKVFAAIERVMSVNTRSE